MSVAYEAPYRGGGGWSSSAQQAVCLEDKFEVIKDIGDGSFGSVALGRTRSAGAHIVRRGTLVCRIASLSLALRVRRPDVLTRAPLFSVLGGDQDDEEDL